MAQPNEHQLIMQKYQTAVNLLTVRAVGGGIGGLFFFIGLVTLFFTTSLSSTLLGVFLLGFGLLFGGLSLLRAWKMGRWPLLLVKATVLEKRKVTFRGTRYYLRLQILQAKKNRYQWLVSSCPTSQLRSRVYGQSTDV